MKIKTSIATYLICLLLSATPLLSQTFSLTGKISDKNTQEPLVGGYVYLSEVEGDTKFNAVSDADGSFIIRGLSSGEYVFHARYIGYQEVIKTVRIVSQNIDLGSIPLTFESKNLNAVEVITRQQRAVLLGDTTQYNAQAYATHPDANAEDLLQKMPGFTTETDGKTAAQGETVQQVLVDGKPFFGEDPTTTLKNMPAGVISKIQVFDDESEESKATGFSDGNTRKTVNIILKEEFKNSRFGSFYGGYGYDNKYSLHGNVNFFKGDRRISIIGQSNNINIQNFSTADLLGVSATVAGRQGGRRRGGGRGPSISGDTNDFLIAEQGGISNTNAVGINYQDTWGKAEVIGSYFFNQSDNTNRVKSTQEYFSSDFPFSYTENSETETSNLNHRANLQMRYKIDRQNELIIKPSLTIQQNRGSSEGISHTFSDKNLTNILTETLTTDLSALNFANTVFFNHRFKKRGRSISLRTENGLSTSKGDQLLFSENSDEDETVVSRVNQNSISDNLQSSVNIGFRYTEPLGKNSGLLLGYEYGHKKNEADVLTYNYDEETQDFDIVNSTLSSTFNNNYLSHQADLGYRYRKGDLSFMLRTRLQTAGLSNKQILPNTITNDKSFNNILPSANLRYDISREKKLRISYRSSTQLPEVSDLQEVVDNSSVLQITVGNADLSQQLDHRFTLRYSAGNSEKATVFFALLSATASKDYLGENTFIANGTESIGDYLLTEGVQVTQPTNLKGYLQSNAFLSYGMPLTALKSNLNINAGGSFKRTPALFNDELLLTNSENIKAGITLSSNINPSLDFTLATTSNVTFTQGEYVSQPQVFYQTTRVEVNYIRAEKWRAATNLTHNYYAATEQSFANWNASVGYKFFKNNRAEISLSIYDILNSNTAIEQTFTDTYYEETESLALQRFLMLGFRYNLQAYTPQISNDKKPPPPFGR